MQVQFTIEIGHMDGNGLVPLTPNEVTDKPELETCSSAELGERIADALEDNKYVSVRVTV